MFKKGLPQRDALCPRLFTICLNPVAWKISASEGYKLSKPISARVTDLLYTDLKVFAASESKLNRVLESTQAAMEDIGLQWNPRKCTVVHIRRGVHFQQNFGRDIVGDRVPTLEEGRQYKFLGVLESLVHEEKMVLELLQQRSTCADCQSSGPVPSQTITVLWHLTNLHCQSWIT